jgi:hypothetical protein
MVFCPVAPWIGVFAAVVSFWTYYTLVKQTCHPPKKRQKGITQISFIQTMAMTLVICSGPLIYIMRVYTPNCGPFVGPDYTSMLSGLAVWPAAGSHAESLVNVMQEPTVLWILLFCQVVGIVYVREKLQLSRNRYKELQLDYGAVNDELRDMLGSKGGDSSVA